MQKGVVVILVLIAVVLVAVGILYFPRGSNNSYNTGTNTNPGTGGQQTRASSTPNTSGTGTSGGTQTTPQTYSVSIQNMAFGPSSLTIKAGDSVTWTNMDSVPHTVTSDSGSELSSGTLSGASSGGYYSSPSAGGTYTHTFSTLGTYSYHCSIHTYMKATIIVQ